MFFFFVKIKKLLISCTLTNLELYNCCFKETVESNVEKSENGNVLEEVLSSIGFVDDALSQGYIYI